MQTGLIKRMRMRNACKTHGKIMCATHARSAYLSLRLVTTTLFGGAIFAYTMPLAIDKPKFPHPSTAMVVLGSMVMCLQGL